MEYVMISETATSTGEVRMTIEVPILIPLSGTEEEPTQELAEIKKNLKEIYSSLLKLMVEEIAGIHMVMEYGNSKVSNELIAIFLEHLRAAADEMGTVFMKNRPPKSIVENPFN